MSKQPRNALMSALSTEEERKKLAQHCCQRFQELDNGMGAWRDKRRRYQEMAESDFTSRQKTKGDDTRPDNIFEKQNDSLEMVNSITEFMIARTFDDILGTGDFFSLSPEGKSDKDLADGLQKHADWKIRNSDVVPAFRSALSQAFIKGEGLVKMRWKRKERWFESLKEVLTDGKKPIVLADGSYVLPEEAEDYFKLNSGQKKKFEKGKLLFQEMYVEDSVIEYDNLSAGCINHDDFVADLTVPTLDESKLVGHKFGMPLYDVRDTYKLDTKTFDLLRQNSVDPKAEGEKADAARGETTASDSTEQGMQNPNVLLAECAIDYIVRDRVCRLLVVVAVDHEILLWGDYLANHTPKGKVPIKCVRIEEAAPNRWYGKGWQEKFEAEGEYIDRQFCYVNYHNRFASSPMKFVNRSALFDSGAESLIVAPDKLWELKQDKTMKEAFEFLVLPDLDDRTWTAMQSVMQLLQLRTGVTSAAQGGVDSVPQNGTATGVEAILNAGNVLAKSPAWEAKKGLQDALLMGLEMIYTRMDREETFTYLEGEHPEVITITPDQVRNLSLNVKLTMTRFRQREMRENAKAALEAVAQYLSFPPEVQSTCRTFFVEIVSSLGFEDAEALVPQPAQPQQAPALPAPL